MTRLTSTTFAGFALLLVACGGGNDQPEAIEPGYAIGDSLVPITDAAPLPEETPPVVESPAAAPPPAPRPRPVVQTPRPSPPPAPAPAPVSRALAAGTTISASTMDSIHTRYNKVGDQVRVRVRNDITNDAGRVVIPAGSVVTLAVVSLAPASNKGETGTLILSARSVQIDGESYPLTARVTSYQSELKSRGIGAGEVAKTGAGAVAGGIIGRAIGGKTGTVIGAVGGAAAGAAIANETVDRDIVVAAGNSVTLVLSDEFATT